MSFKSSSRATKFGYLRVKSGFSVADAAVSVVAAAAVTTLYVIAVDRCLLSFVSLSLLQASSTDRQQERCWSSTHKMAHRSVYQKFNQ